MIDLKDPTKHPQVTMIGGHPETTSIAVAAYLRISHDELMAQIEHHLAKNQERQEQLQEDRLDKSAQLYPRYRMTDVAVHEITEFFADGNTDVSTRRKAFIAAMEAAQDEANR